jgi:hypothetical protein
VADLPIVSQLLSEQWSTKFNSGHKITFFP